MSSLGHLSFRDKKQGGNGRKEVRRATTKQMGQNKYETNVEFPPRSCRGPKGLLTQVWSDGRRQAGVIVERENAFEMLDK